MKYTIDEQMLQVAARKKALLVRRRTRSLALLGSASSGLFVFLLLSTGYFLYEPPFALSGMQGVYGGAMFYDRDPGGFVLAGVLSILVGMLAAFFAARPDKNRRSQRPTG